MMEDPFDFDAPCTWMDLSAVAVRGRGEDEEVDEWFLEYHPRHFPPPAGSAASSRSRKAPALGGRPARRASANGGGVKSTSVPAAAASNAPASSSSSLRRQSSGLVADEHISMKEKLELYRSRKRGRAAGGDASSSSSCSVAADLLPASAPARILHRSGTLSSSSSRLNTTDGISCSEVPGRVAKSSRRSTCDGRVGLGPHAAVGAPAARSKVAIHTVRSQSSISSRPKVAKTAAVAAVATKKKKKKEQEGGDMGDIEALIQQHNRGVMSSRATFEPARHSLKDVKAWEQKTGQKYRSLGVDQRAAANREIDGMISASSSCP